MNEKNIVAIDKENRRIVNEFIIEHWGDNRMVIRDEVIDLSSSEGFCVVENDELIGVITYCISYNECEITLLHSLYENQGIGTKLVEKIVKTAKDSNVKKIKVITTNDNIRAIMFYQKRGFDMSNFYRNAMDNVRKIKKNVPFIGENEIPLKHELEFEMIIV